MFTAKPEGEGCGVASKGVAKCALLGARRCRPLLHRKVCDVCAIAIPHVVRKEWARLPSRGACDAPRPRLRTRLQPDRTSTRKRACERPRLRRPNAHDSTSTTERVYERRRLRRPSCYDSTWPRERACERPRLRRRIRGGYVGHQAGGWLWSTAQASSVAKSTRFRCRLASRRNRRPTCVVPWLRT